MMSPVLDQAQDLGPAQAPVPAPPAAAANQGAATQVAARTPAASQTLTMRNPRRRSSRQISRTSTERSSGSPTQVSSRCRDRPCSGNSSFSSSSSSSRDKAPPTVDQMRTRRAAMNQTHRVDPKGEEIQAPQTRGLAQDLGVDRDQTHQPRKTVTRRRQTTSQVTKSKAKNPRQR